MIGGVICTDLSKAIEAPDRNHDDNPLSNVTGDLNVCPTISIMGDAPDTTCMIPMTDTILTLMDIMRLLEFFRLHVKCIFVGSVFE